MSLNHRAFARVQGVCALVLISLTACQPTGSGSAKSQGPVEVASIKVQARALPLVVDLPGRVEALLTAEVRARVAGVVLSRDFTEGADVHKGQVLYRIDPAPFRATLTRALATLASAQAQATQQQARTERIRALAPSGAVSAQELDDANALLSAATASVTAAQAAVESAKIDLDYTVVTAPISGRIGRAEVTQGALVGQGSPTLLATIQQLDTVYVNLTQSVADLRHLRRALAEGQVEPVQSTPIELVFDDGSVYAQQGELLFTDVSVEPTTGTVSLRARVPNPDHELLPGAYVRARLARALVENGLTVPQQAISRTPTGAYVMTVTPEGIAKRQDLTLGGTIGQDWRVLGGLESGSEVVTEGLQYIRDGSPVTTRPWK